MSDELLNNIFITYNHSSNTRRGYKASLTQYSDFFNMTLRELLEEAEAEENKGVKWKHSKLKNRLLTFRQYLLETRSLRSVQTRIGQVIKFYRFYDIEVQTLPRVNVKSAINSVPIFFKDLPDKEIIREAIGVSSPLMKAIILFMCSSGCGRAEATNLTIQDYIDALTEYIPNKRMNIFEIIDFISDNDSVIPTFNILRKKTRKYYITYCSPEAVKAINSYLLSRTDNVTNESKLFKAHPQYLTTSFQKINDTLGLGRVGNYGRFRAHMLRKFHASALYNDGMSIDKVNDMQGKAKNKTDASYFMTNPEDLKYDYIQHLHAVTIGKDVEKLSIKSPEFMQMETENKALRGELDKLRSDVDFLINGFSEKQ